MTKKATVTRTHLNTLFVSSTIISNKPKYANNTSLKKKAKIFTNTVRNPQLLEAASIHVDKFPMENIMKIVDMVQRADGQWAMSKLSSDYLDEYLDHASWVYFLTIDGYIVKIGETGVQLIDPLRSTTSEARLNKYFGYNDDRSERYIRTMLLDIMDAGQHQVSFYAVPIPICTVKLKIGKSDTIQSKANKDAELLAIDTFKDSTKNGELPLLNRTRK